jgi:small-conductance mechanosensitive channel
MPVGQQIWSFIRNALFWAPDWLSGVAILMIAAAAAIVINLIIFALLRRFDEEQHPFLRLLRRRVRGLTGFALVAFALAAALQWAPFNPAVSAALSHLLLIAFIVLAGWIAHNAVETAAHLYLLRFRVESTDDFLARKHITQVRILTRAAHTLIVVITLAAALMTFEAVRDYGVSLFASAGVAGLVVGLAARPMLSNLIAGIQIATTQPIRLDDQVVVENESGRIEEITSTYVVVRVWDLRRLIVPLTYFIEKPFQNWTRDATNLLGTVLIYVDYTAPVERIREQFLELVKASKLWDGQVASLQVTDARETSIELRALVSARTAGDAFDLRCEIREKLIDFLRREFPSALPHQRQEAVNAKPFALPAGEPARPPSGV